VKIIKILIADDDKKNRFEIRSILQTKSEYFIVGEARNGQEAIQFAEELHPDIILMDIVMPILNGLDATREISYKFPKVKVILLTYYCDNEYAQAASKSGAKGCLTKDASIIELKKAIEMVDRGGEYFYPNSSQVSNEITEFSHK
jgi:DNA-binding NarL/FixJ family response regulator